jgi:hypothetical protein
MDSPPKRGLEFAKGAAIPPPVLLLAGGIGWELLKRGTGGARVLMFAVCLAALVLVIAAGALFWRKRRWRAYGLFGSFALCITVVGVVTALLINAMGTVIGG